MIEYGGCLPTERFLTKIVSDFPFDPHFTLAFNSGRSAIYFAAKCGNAHTVLLPRYTCPTIKEFLVMHDICTREYSLTADFLPDQVVLSDGELLLWTNYNGCLSTDVISQVSRRYAGKLIMDNAQAFFSPPISGAFNVYSARKFIGVPDGAFLISSLELQTFLTLDQDESSKSFSTFLNVAANQGSNAAYPLYLENEHRFDTGLFEMSNYTRNRLNQIDYSEIRFRRERNFNALHHILKDFNLAPFNFSSKTAFYYPFLVYSEGLRDHLIAKKVFVPRWWKHVLAIPESSALEIELARFLLPLPIDQRYNEKDMEQIAQFVINFLNDKPRGRNYNES